MKLDVEKIRSEVSQDWQIVDGHHLRREFGFKNFVQALEFVNKVGAHAEEVGHHPDIHLSWGKAVVKVWTHTADGITALDVDFANAVDNL